MADDLTQAEAERVEILPEPSRAQPLVANPRNAVLLTLLIVALVACAWLAWKAFGPRDEGDVVGSAMLAFEKQNSLTVFSSRFEVVAESVNTPSVGPLPIDALKTRQAMIVPARVEYRLDLSAMDRGDFSWDEERQALDVTLPPLSLSTPNVDEAQARFFTDGLYVSRDASVSLSRNNSEIAERKAREFASNPEIMALARSAAREAVRQNLAIPLQVAGFGDVSVTVRFDDEPATAKP